jgi:uncharacterized protein YyaL (SSP411 family)
VTNRLAGQASAYLASAAHQPVHWYPWGEEAFAAARELGRPILLDIGAVWCHWCHVMDGESYEDPGTAEYLNAHFVCVKVDRDERPDVDARYQRAVQALTGQGGWPLTAFLTPDGDVYYGGTYFPPDGHLGRPGFRAVLERVAVIYSEERTKVAATARELRSHVSEALREAKAGPLDEALLSQGAERMARLFDWRYGGFGAAPKFPHPSAVLFLLSRWWDSREPWLVQVVEKTLDGMARGGMYDQLAGGFHRYSIDERWCVPHFEKMSYDNAELLRAYLAGYAALERPLWRETAEGVIGWCLDVLADRERGGFGASQDADVGLNDDGDYFTWSAGEARAVLGADEWEVASRRWDIGEQGEMHHDPSRNVLWVARSTSALSAELGRPEAEVKALLERAKQKLARARAQRTAPFVDRSIYVSWNAMLAEAFLEAGAILNRPDCTAHAFLTLRRLWDEAFVPGRGMPHRMGVKDGPWLLEDQVHAASAFLAAFEHSGEGAWLDRGRELLDMVLVFHHDEAAGGFFDTAGGGEGFLAERAKPVQDAPTASPNAAAALALLRLGGLTHEERWGRAAERAVAAFAGSAAELGIHGSTWLRALDWLVRGECRVEVSDDGSKSLHRLALRRFRPRRVVLPRRGSLAGREPPVALVCSLSTCAAPVGTEGELLEVLETFGRGG